MNLSLIGSAAIASLTISALICGKIMQYGRLKVLNLACIVGIIGLLCMLNLNLYMIIFGRFLYGFSTGLILVAAPRFQEEVVPPTLVSLFGAFYCFSKAIATLIGFLLAIGLPSDYDNKGKIFFN